MRSIARSIGAVGAVFWFEWRRAVGWSRLGIVAMLACFPAGILGLVHYAGGSLPHNEARVLTLFILVPELVCLLALLLWATPAIHAEVEGKTWSYLAVRPAGKVPILFGKYAAATVWSMSTGWVALSLALLVLGPPNDGLFLGTVLGGLVALSCAVYGALFTLLGVVFLRRAMTVAVAYVLLEITVRMIPAMIRELTVQYHLQGLLVQWMGWHPSTRVIQELFGRSSPCVHLVALLGFAVVSLGVAAAILRQRELITAPET